MVIHLTTINNTTTEINLGVMVISLITKLFTTVKTLLISAIFKAHENSCIN